MSALTRWRAATAACALVILVISVVPVDPKLAPGHVDKVAHLCEYLLFAWLLAHALQASRASKLMWAAWGWATAYGAAIELLQALIPWRSAEVMDALTNAVGAALGVWIARATLGKS